MQLSHFDLNLLRALDALLSERSVTRAAERLYLTQQALSGALNRLREHFEDKLLVQVGRQMELTPLAQALIQPVHLALQQIRVVVDTQPRFDASTTRMTIRIATSDYPTFVLLPNLVRALATDAPGVLCEVERLEDASFQSLESGDLDFCIAPIHWRLFRAYEPSRDIKTLELFSDDYVCAVDKSHPNVGDALTMSEYQGLAHNCVRLDRGILTWVEQAWRDAGLRLKIAATVPNFLTLLCMLPGTPLVGTVQRRLAQAFAPCLGLRLLECPFPLKSLSWHLAWHARTDRNPAHDYVRAAIMSAAHPHSSNAPQRQTLENLRAQG